MADIVLSYDNVAAYEDNGAYFGVTVGRYANRICQGRCVVDGRTLQLATNNGANHLHGGPTGFSRQLWHMDHMSDNAITFSLCSPDGHEGYPGELRMAVTYSITELEHGCSLSIAYEATTNATTIINLTNHSYFCLPGTSSTTTPSLVDVRCRINADRYCAIDDGAIPTPDTPHAVTNTVFDLRDVDADGLPKTRFGDRLQHTGLSPTGYDHNYCVNSAGDLSVVAATLYDAKSGRRLDMFTTEPGVQLYTSNYLSPPHQAVCLEAQRWPDTPNRPDFGSALLLPSDVYRQQTIYRITWASPLCR